MTDEEFELLRKRVTQLRRAIDRAKVEYESPSDLPFVNHWPKDCCDAPFLRILFDQWGYKPPKRRCADVTHYGEDFTKHVWYELDGITIDITADQFPGVTDKVIVTRDSAWHKSLNVIKERRFAASNKEWLKEIYKERFSDLHWVLEDVLPRFCPPLEEC